MLSVQPAAPMDSSDSDAAYARQLQDEEFNFRPHSNSNQSGSGSGAGSAESSHVRINLVPQEQLGGGAGEGNNHRGRDNPHQEQRENRLHLLGAAARQPQHRQVHANAAHQAQLIQENSPTLLAVYLLFGLIESIMAIVVLSKGWNQYCDRPLRTGIVLYSGRWLFLIPLAIARFRRRHIVFSEQNPDQLLKAQTWVRFLAFVWVIVLQYWFFTSHCSETSPWLWKFALALIIVFYIGVFAPILILLVICLCLPCALIFFQIFQTDPGAPPDVISGLPKRTFQPSPDIVGDPPSCAICMEDYKAGDELRQLPACSHEFHVPCVDRWLGLNHTCPLCRKSVVPGEVAAGDAQV